MRRRARFLPFSTLALLGALVLVGAGLAGCGADAVPDFVSYSRQIQPLVEARCVRCHGAGGTLNLDTDISPSSTWKGAPTNGYFNMLGNTTGADGSTHYGLMHYTVDGKNEPAGGPTLAIAFINSPMPPPPAPKLSDREYDLLTSWLNNPYP